MADAIDIGDDWEAEPVDHDPFTPAPQGLGAIAHAGGIGSDAVASGAADTPAPPPMSAADRDTLIRTVAGEAGSEPPQGQAAVAHTILNRVAAGGYGDGISGVALAPTKPGSQFHEYSTWNPPKGGGSPAARNIDPQSYQKVGQMVDMAYSGEYPDLTGGATHYYAPRGMPGGKPPAQWPQQWFKTQPKTTIGHQVFVSGSGGPGQQLPDQIAGGPYDEGTSGT